MISYAKIKFLNLIIPSGHNLENLTSGKTYTVVKYLQKWCQMDTLLKNSHHTVFDTGHKIVALSYKT